MADENEMEFEPLKTCCCGCSLKTGCILIGILNVVLGVLGFGINSAFFIVQCISFDEQNKIAAKLLCVESGYMFVFLLKAIAGSLLIHGARNGIPKFMTWWMNITLAGICAGVVVNIVQNIFLNTMVAVSGLYVANICLSGYFITIVRSYRQQLVDQGADLNMFQKF